MIDHRLFIHATEPDLTRFLANVQASGQHWMWTGCVNGSGYGTFAICGEKVGAHRVAYEWANGPIFSWLEADHKCRQQLCVYPAHLEVVTHLENVRRGKSGEFIRNSNHPLAKHLCDRQVSITDFARSVFVSPQTIVAMMRGHRPADPDITYRIGEAIGLSWEETDDAFPRRRQQVVA
jgi:hypothetical protein